ncbi:kinase-like domain-containing protein [Ampelomyces quisqualis]|uniref:Altered inheritance of mitochondria protein 9, mitochondrial n=1 Tax=Ampelomyces quisqualis TaxID=50730 RepID=A0A6A5QDD0_AMPQU|nr:kinase-like domain-containing protein [Ampelomyces quisqualis]
MQADISEKDFFNYKAQRWLWNEPDQLRRRYLKFDLKALIRVAERAVGGDASCVEVTKLPEGNFNKTFLVKMHDGRQLIARLPNPNAGRSHYTTASEVATMDYARDRLHIPIPKIFTYNTNAKSSDVGAEYIVMEECPGIELSRLWDDLAAKQKIDIVRQLATFSTRLSKARFAYYGSLYYAKDIPEITGTEVDSTFSVGPTTSRTWFDDGRGDVDVFRGPWNSAKDVLMSILTRESACLDQFSSFPRDRQQGIFNGPGGYQPSKDTKMAVIKDCIRVLPYIMPKDDASTASILWHNDLHSDNIFVNEDCPTEITSIIDWQSVHLSPAFLHVHHPSLIEYDGPTLETFEKPVLPPDFAELAPDDKDTARALHTAQSIRVLYDVFIHRQAPDLVRVLRYRDTLPCQIMNLVGSTFDDGEAYVQDLLFQLAEDQTWATVTATGSHVSANNPCPLVYEQEYVKQQKHALRRWERDVERKARVLGEIGAYTGWDGAVSPEDHDALSENLEQAKERFLNAESQTAGEREQWGKRLAVSG